jgi:hypothetical protein
MRRLEQAANMLAATENRRPAVISLVAAHPLKYGQPIVEAMGQHVDGGLIVWNQGAIHPDFVGAQVVCSQRNDLTRERIGS